MIDLRSHAAALETTAKVGAAAAGSGAATWLGYNYLQYQARATRQRIGRPHARPLRADGIYLGESLTPQRYGQADLHLMVFGDSTAAGLGCEIADETPGVLLARGLAAETGKRVRLSTKAIVGATSRGLESQVDAMFIAGPPPDAAVILIGANDVTSAQPPRTAAARVGDAVGRLAGSGAAVVVGTCPDLGVIAAIPQPLRSVTRRWGLLLARLQGEQTRKAGGVAVPLADLLAPEFLAAPDMMFSPDRFHPSAAGYALAAEQLLPALCDALGLWRGGPIAELPTVSATAESMRPMVRARRALHHLVRRRQDTDGSALVQAFPLGPVPAQVILDAAERQQT
ncbi:SGNH/GDSL hydrolase family protein [Tomitella biformata]|uniref:SGNH/GDSL hydrolase family protein n=1 Tax=Tomitella biformata TaxID=630403 RepID=UPI0004677A39|nr:SGNH/GDSL hydrolase family protein [Tomitella biformata]